MLLVYLSKGVEKDKTVKEALSDHPEASLLAVHESDDRKDSCFRDFHMLGEEGEEVARLLEVESMPMQRRSYLQQAMISAIVERMKATVVAPRSSRFSPSEVAGRTDTLKQWRKTRDNMQNDKVPLHEHTTRSPQTLMHAAL